MKTASREAQKRFIQSGLDFAVTKRSGSRALSAVLSTSLCVFVLILRVSAQGSFTKVTTGPVVTDVEQSTGCAWGDFDNDGFIDLMVTCFDRTSANALYHNERDGTFTRFAAGAVANDANLRSAGCTWVDYDNDGFL